MAAVFFEQNSVVRVPELDSAVVRAAGTQLVLTGLATEGEARHSLLVSGQTPCRETETGSQTRSTELYSYTELVWSQTLLKRPSKVLDRYRDLGIERYLGMERYVGY